MRLGAARELVKNVPIHASRDQETYRKRIEKPRDRLHVAMASNCETHGNVHLNNAGEELQNIA